MRPLLLTILLALLFVAPAYAADEWDVLLPDEYGLAAFVVPAVERSDLGLSLDQLTGQVLVYR